MKFASPLIRFVIAMTGLHGAAFGAVVLVSDDFSGTGGLNGQTPDTTVNSAAWNANAVYQTNGTLSSNSGNTSGFSAYLNLGEDYFADHPGIYDLSVDVFFTANASPGTTYLGVGFSGEGSSAGSTATNAVMGSANSRGTPWMFLRENGQLIVRSNNNTDLFSSSTGDYASGSSYRLRLVLNTSLPLWTVDAYVGSVQLDLNGAAAGFTYAYAANPEVIRYLTFSTNNNAGAWFDNLQLTFAAIPEPSGGMLLGMGVLGLAAFRRRKAREILL